MFVAGLIKALLLTQASVMSKPIGTSQDGTEVAAVADNVLTRQLLLLDENPLPDDEDLIRLKNGMQAHVPTAALDEDETINSDSPAFPSRLARLDLAPRIFLSAPAESEEDDGALDSVL